jgi:hypothetical protein
MAFLPPAVFEIKAVADQAVAKFKDVNKELEKMEGASKDAGGSVAGIDKASRMATAGLLAMGAAFVGFAAIGIKGVIEDEKAFNKLGQTFSNLGINIEANRNLVGELDTAYSKLGFGGDETATALNRLLSTTNDLEKSQELLSVSADLARVKNIDLASASAIVGKASMGGAKAFKEMGIELDTTLPRAEAITKAMGQLTDKVGGQAVAYTKTFAGQLVVLREQISAVADTVGAALLPYLKQAVETIANAIDFVKSNAAAFKVLLGVILTITIALAAYNATIKVQMALTKAWSVITGVQAAITKLLTGQQVALNTAMRLNPIGLIVSAAVLLIGALVLLWNKSETFRKMMIQIGKVGLMALGFLIKVTGDYAQSVIKLVTGPLKLLLKGLSLLGVGGAKEALKGLESATEGVGKFFDSAAKKVTDMAGSLDKLNKPIKLTFAAPPGVPEIANVTGGGATGGGTSGASSAGNAAAKKANEGYMKIVKDLQDKVSSAKSKFNEKMLEAETAYNEDVVKINAEYSERKAEIEAQYAETKLNLETKKGEDLAKAAEDNQKRVIEITKAGQEKLQQIVQQSIDRLRDSFRKGTEFNVSDIFTGLAEAGTQSADGLIDALKSRLTAAKDLAANAAKLQAQGFSQTFIEQVVAAGPQVGNELAASILNAKPETIAELKATYTDLEKLTNTGLDAVANAMNNGGQLATAELNQAYQQAKIDTQNMLTEQTKAYADAQAAITKQFDKDMAEAANTRDKALLDAKTAMDKAIAEANKALADAQAAARKQLTDDLTAINKEFTDKLAGVRDANQKTIDSINALKAAMASAASLSMSAPASGTPVSGFTPYITTPTTKAGSQGFIGPVAINNNTNVVAQTNASPVAIAKTVTASAKLAATVTVSSINTSQGTANKLKAMGLYAL